MTEVVMVALGGAFGAVLRHAVGHWLVTPSLAWATVTVNVAGSLLLGVVAATGPAWAVTLLGTGVAGALTTYSAFALDTVVLDRRRAVGYVAVTFALATAGFALGWWLGST